MMVILMVFVVVALVGLFLFRSRGDTGQATMSRSSHSKERKSVSKRPKKKARKEPKIEDQAGDAVDEILGLKTALHEDEVLETVTPEPAMPLQPKKEPQIIALNVMAPAGQPYRGYELLQALLANGLRYGDMQIFHRHETKTGRGKVLFSLASVAQPGTFELPKMGSFSSPGLTLFMLLNPNIDCMFAFDTMLEVTKQLVDDLGGEVQDAHRRSLNMDTVAQLRLQIKQFEEDQRVPDLFADMVS